jgi:hypothetical protein
MDENRESPMKIAQHFSAGNIAIHFQVPPGTEEPSAVPDGTLHSMHRFPALKCWAIVGIFPQRAFPQRCVFSQKTAKNSLPAPCFICNLRGENFSRSRMTEPAAQRSTKSAASNTGRRLAASPPHFAIARLRRARPSTPLPRFHSSQTPPPIPTTPFGSSGMPPSGPAGRFLWSGSPPSVPTTHFHWTETGQSAHSVSRKRPKMP